MLSYQWSYRHLFFCVVILLLSACDETQSDYFPLDGHSQWIYHTTSKKLDKTFRQNYIVANVGKLVIDNSAVYVRQAVSGTRKYYQRTDNGILRLGERTEEQLQPEFYRQAVTILPFPLEIDKRWQVKSDVRLIESKTFEMRDRLYLQQPEVLLDYVIESLSETITVPAGTFHNCLRIRGAGNTGVRVNRGNSTALIQVESIRWYAPGVGLVKTERSETSASVFLKEGRYSMELEEFRP